MLHFRGLVLDATATSILSQADIEPKWFDDPALPRHAKGLRQVNLNGFVYIFSELADESVRAVVIPAIIINGLLNKTQGFDRILHIALSHFDRRVSIPVGYQQFNHGSLVSIYANPIGRGITQRIYFERSPHDDSHHLYVYALTPETKDITSVPIGYETYDAAIGGLIDALGGVLINETARVPVDGPVHHRSPPRRVQVVPATAIIPK